MVDQPAFNPNDRDQMVQRRYRNRAVTDVYEPGSSMKPFFVAAGSISGNYDDRSIIDTSPGFIKVGAHVFTGRARPRADRHRHGARQELECRHGAPRAVAAAASSSGRRCAAYGFGQLATSGYPGESAGLLAPLHTWRPIDIATMSHGYGVSVTTLQLAHAYATVGALGISAADFLPASRHAAGGHAGDGSGALPRADSDDALGDLAGRHRAACGDPGLHASPARPARPGRPTAARTSSTLRLGVCRRRARQLAAPGGCRLHQRSAERDPQGGDVSAPVFAQGGRPGAAPHGRRAGRAGGAARGPADGLTAMNSGTCNCSSTRRDARGADCRTPRRARGARSQRCDARLAHGRARRALSCLPRPRASRRGIRR